MEKEPGLKIVDAFDLDPEVRSLLMPQEMAEGKDGHQHQLPRYFYEIPSHEAAREVRLSQPFGLNELLLVDLKEAERLAPIRVTCLRRRIMAFYWSACGRWWARHPPRRERRLPPPAHKSCP